MLVTPENFGKLNMLIFNGTISGKIAKTIIGEMFLTGKSPEEIVKEKGITDAELGRILWFVDSGIRIEVIEMEKTFNRVIRWSTSENSNHFAFHDIGLLIEYLQNSYKKMIDIQKKRNRRPYYAAIILVE